MIGKRIKVTISGDAGIYDVIRINFDTRRVIIFRASEYEEFSLDTVTLWLFPCGICQEFEDITHQSHDIGDRLEVYHGTDVIGYVWNERTLRCPDTCATFQRYKGECPVDAERINRIPWNKLQNGERAQPNQSQEEQYEVYCND